MKMAQVELFGFGGTFWHRWFSFNGFWDGNLAYSMYQTPRSFSGCKVTCSGN